MRNHHETTHSHSPGYMLLIRRKFLHHTGFAVVQAFDRQTLLLSGRGQRSRRARRVGAFRRAVCRAAVAPGRDTTLKESEILPLQTVDAPLNGFPQGDHTVSVGVRIDANRRLWMLCNSTYFWWMPVSRTRTDWCDKPRYPPLRLVICPVIGRDGTVESSGHFRGGWDKRT